jgi:hypothetical protein
VLAPAHPEDVFHFECPAEESNPGTDRHGCRLVVAVPKAAVRSNTLARRRNIPTWIRTRTWSFGGSNAIRYTTGTTSFHYAKADDWIRTSMSLFTRQAPFSVEPPRQARADQPASMPVGARSRTPSASFGDWLPTTGLLPSVPAGAHSYGPRTSQPLGRFIP